MPAGDLLDLVAAPLRQQIEVVLAPHLPAPAVGGLAALVDTAALVALGMALATLGRASTRAPTRAARGLLVALGVVGGGLLLAWLATHPSPRQHELFLRGDHLAFAALGGMALARAPLGWRVWIVGALSVGFLAQYSGTRAVGICLGAAVAAFATLRLPFGRRPWVAVLVHALIGIVVYGFCWRLRGGDFLGAVYVVGLFVFFFLRQISFAVSACQGGGGDLGSYLCYLLFYPGVTGAFGGPEVWSEFSRRNLGERTNAEHARAGSSVLRGALQVWAAERIPMSADVVFASPMPALAWINSLILLVKVALMGMGVWALIDATASFYGFRLRPNFEGILRARNPSELWRSWRGTLTNWLVTHVYAPLGANRRHQALNILAAFGVSLVWHWAGVPFFDPDFTAAQLLPITLWAAINAIAVVAHVQATRHGWRLLPDATPPRVRQALHHLGTLCLGTFSVTLPSAQLGVQEKLGPFLRCLFGACT